MGLISENQPGITAEIPLETTSGVTASTSSDLALFAAAAAAAASSASIFLLLLSLFF
jgi:hypothetical protein